MSAPSLDQSKSLILQNLGAHGIRTECAARGVKFSGEPNASGWLSCHAIDREDSSPSAAVCVGGANGELAGYNDLGGDGLSLSFWDLMAMLGPAEFPTWLDALRHFAEQTGVALPTSGSGGAAANESGQAPPSTTSQPDSDEPDTGASNGKEAPALEAQFVESDWFNSRPPFFDLMTRGLREAKAPVTPVAIRTAGGRMATWPAASQEPLNVIALPAFRGPDSQPSAFVLLRACGRQFPGVENGLPERKAHLVKGSPASWLISDRAKLADAFIVWIVEGVSDMLALSGAVPAGEVVVSPSKGANSTAKLPFDLLAGKKLIVVGDADTAGQAGAEAFATRAATVASEVRLVKLPYPVVKKHGRDLRDFLTDGGTVEQLKEMAATTTPLSSSKPGCIANSDEVASSDGKLTIIKPRTISPICNDFWSITDGWPRRVGASLFVHEIDSIRWLDNQAALFAYGGSKSLLPPHFRRDANLHTRGDVFEHLRATAENYEAVETLPHEPPIEGCYYACEWPQPGDGSALQGLVSKYSPATDVDGDLITAMFATAFWGGPAGARPAFLIDSDAGRARANRHSRATWPSLSVDQSSFLPTRTRA